jgi:ABC-type molybdenum transport system ATPase subunit/photorepair protein PhrA
MYIDRPDLEERLTQGIKASQHLVIHGESGSGKSWLYKRVFDREKVTYKVGNLADAARFGSLNALFQQIVDREGKATKVGYAETKEAEISTVVAKGGLSHEGQYELGQKDSFEKCIALVRSKAGSHGACLVLDNLEAVFASEALMDELAGC